MSPATILVGGTGIVLALPLVVRIVWRTFDPFEPIVIFSLAYGVMFVARPASMLAHGLILCVRCSSLRRPTVSPFRARARLSQK
jgi:hypothetical protein